VSKKQIHQIIENLNWKRCDKWSREIANINNLYLYYFLFRR